MPSRPQDKEANREYMRARRADPVLRAAELARRGELRVERAEVHAARRQQVAASFDHLTDTDLAYIAGIIDGEGHLGARLHAASPSPYALDIALRVGMTHQPTIEWLRDHCGGHIGTKAIKGKRTRILYEWRLGRERGAHLLRLALPYLITKHEEAELWLEIADLVGSKRRKPLPEIHERRVALITDLVNLRRAS